MQVPQQRSHCIATLEGGESDRPLGEHDHAHVALPIEKRLGNPLAPDIAKADEEQYRTKAQQRRKVQGDR